MGETVQKVLGQVKKAWEYARHPFGWTIRSAINEDKKQYVYQYLRRGGSPDISNHFDKTALMTAANILDDDKCSRRLIDRADRTKRTFGKTLLFFMVRNPHLDLIRYTAQSEPDLYRCSRVGGTALHEAARKAPDPGTLRLLIEEFDLSVSTVGNIGHTPLHEAAKRANERFAKVLLQNDADPNYFNNEEFTPLHKASLWARHDTVQRLLEAGANPNATGGNRIKRATPLLCAIDALNHNEKDKKPIVGEQTVRPIVQCLLEAGADPDKRYGGTRGRAGVGPLDQALIIGAPRVGADLFEAGATFTTDALNRLQNHNIEQAKRGKFISIVGAAPYALDRI